MEETLEQTVARLNDLTAELLAKIKERWELRASHARLLAACKLALPHVIYVRQNREMSGGHAYALPVAQDENELRAAIAAAPAVDQMDKARQELDAEDEMGQSPLSP